MKQEVKPGQVWRERDSRFISRHILVVMKFDVERVVCVPCDADGRPSMGGNAHGGRVSKIKIKNVPKRFELVGAVSEGKLS